MSGRNSASLRPLTLGVVIAAIQTLFLAGQYARRVDKRHLSEHIAWQLTALEPVQKCIAELGQRLEVFLGVDNQRIAGHYGLVVAVHDGYERVGGRLGANAYAGKVAFDQIADERCLARRILPDEQNHRLRVEVRVLERRRMEVIEPVGLLEWQQLCFVNLFEAVDDVVVSLGLFLFFFPVVLHSSKWNPSKIRLSAASLKNYIIEQEQEKAALTRTKLRRNQKNLLPELQIKRTHRRIIRIICQRVRAKRLRTCRSDRSTETYTVASEPSYLTTYPITHIHYFFLLFYLIIKLLLNSILRNFLTINFFFFQSRF